MSSSQQDNVISLRSVMEELGIAPTPDNLSRAGKACRHLAQGKISKLDDYGNPIRVNRFPFSLQMHQLLHDSLCAEFTRDAWQGEKEVYDAYAPRISPVEYSCFSSACGQGGAMKFSGFVFGHVPNREELNLHFVLPSKLFNENATGYEMDDADGEEAPPSRRVLPSGWIVKGRIAGDYWSWVKRFEATHPEHGFVKGNFERSVYASSEQALRQFLNDASEDVQEILPVAFCPDDV